MDYFWKWIRILTAYAFLKTWLKYHSFFAKLWMKLLITVPCPKKSNNALMPCPFAYILFVFLAEQNYPRIYFYHVKKAEENFGPYLFNKVGVFKSRLAQKRLMVFNFLRMLTNFQRNYVFGNVYQSHKPLSKPWDVLMPVLFCTFY